MGEIAIDEVLSSFTREGRFLLREGPAHARGEEACQKKLCFTGVAVEPMARLLYALSQREDCWYVKLDDAPLENGMVRGRCFLTTPSAVGAAWRKYKVTPDVLCTIQDDDFTDAYR